MSTYYVLAQHRTWTAPRCPRAASGLLSMHPPGATSKRKASRVLPHWKAHHALLGPHAAHLACVVPATLLAPEPRSSPVCLLRPPRSTCTWALPELPEAGFLWAKLTLDRADQGPCGDSRPVGTRRVEGASLGDFGGIDLGPIHHQPWFGALAVLRPRSGGAWPVLRAAPSLLFRTR